MILGLRLVFFAPSTRAEEAATEVVIASKGIMETTEGKKTIALDFRFERSNNFRCNKDGFRKWVVVAVARFDVSDELRDGYDSSPKNKC